MDNRINLYLISGFLGAGKTTFLRNVLENTQGKRVGVIVNEFGSVGIDGKVLQRGDLKLVEINNGSIFCACLKAGFVKTLVAFLEQPIDMLFIEASGMADPSSMMKLLDDIETLANRNERIPRNYAYQGSICVVDCTTFLDYSEVLTPTKNQVIKSNFILVNKTDLVREDVVERIHEKIHQLNPEAFLIDTHFSQIPLDVLQEHLSIGNETAPTSNQPWNRPATVILEMDEIYSQENVRAFCDALAGSVLRIKGFFRDQKGCVHIDGVGNSIHFEDGPEIDEIAPMNLRVVIIGKDQKEFENDLRRIWKDTMTTMIQFSEE